MKNSNTPRRWSKVPSLSNDLEKSDAGPLSCPRMQRVFFSTAGGLAAPTSVKHFFSVFLRKCVKASERREVLCLLPRRVSPGVTQWSTQPSGVKWTVRTVDR